MTTITKISTHESDAKERIISELKDAENLEKLIGVLSNRQQDLENTSWDLLTQRNIDDAEGAQLDALATTLGIVRGTSDDDQLRIRLYAIIATYRSNGSIEVIISVFRALTQAGSVILTEVFPANIILTAKDAPYPTSTRDQIKDASRSLKAAGVSLDGVIISGETPFVFDGDPAPTGAGFDDLLNPGVGGFWADVL